MTNYGMVSKILADGKAEVQVVRQSACGGNCAGCKGCAEKSIMTAVANNLVNAQVGQRVLIESRTKTIFSAAILVYVMPLVLFLVSYAVASSLGASEGICVLVSFLALVLSGIILVLSQKFKRKKEEIIFNIVEIN